MNNKYRYILAVFMMALSLRKTFRFFFISCLHNLDFYRRLPLQAAACY